MRTVRIDIAVWLLLLGDTYCYTVVPLQVELFIARALRVVPYIQYLYVYTWGMVVEACIDSTACVAQTMEFVLVAYFVLDIAAMWVSPQAFSINTVAATDSDAIDCTRIPLRIVV